MTKKTNPPAATVSRRSALAAVVVALLAGVFLGFSAANVIFNAEHAHAPAPGAGADRTMPPPGMGGQGMAGQVKALEEAAARNPGDVQAWVNLGNLHFDLGDPDKSVEAYGKALAINPKLADVWTDMGVMERARKRPREALAAFAQALAVNPDHEVARLNTGIVLLHDLNDKQAALAAWKDLLARKPEARMPDGRRLADVVRDVAAAK